ncbi:MAG: Wzz/FepE/Etk N-terminal domain-containing protein [Nocardioides sp.]
MDGTNAPQTARLHIRTSLLAHRVLIIAAGVIGLVLGSAVSLLLPSTYTATAGVLIQPLDGNAYSPDAQGSDLTRLETEAQVVASDVIYSDVKSKLADAKLTTPTRGKLGISVASNAQIIQISYTSQNARLAESTAAQFADSYLALRKLRRDTFIDNRRTSLAERIATLTTELDKLRKADRDDEIPPIQAQQTNLRLQLATLEAADTSPGLINTKPIARRGGLSIPLPLGALAGLLAGLLAGAIIALILERKSELLRTVDDIEHLGVAVLGIHHGDEPSAEASADPDAQTPYDVAFLAGTILNRRAVVPATIAISSLDTTAAVGTFANDLAQVLAHGREGVLLIDAQGNEATKHPGFTDVLFGSTELSDALRTKSKAEAGDPVDRLDIGRDPANGPLLYSTSRMSEALATACDSYDWVIISGPEAAITAGRAIVGACDHWIPVIALGQSTRNELERGLAWARTTGVEPLGVVVVDAGETRTRSGMGWLSKP